ncbi:MAG: site-2 protease family protein, partial [Peptoniphilaceae bacterium]|nr:site-2 protease family protein [Peptoniphilaceae bacterium]MDY5766265.1 site-2 protease family protein [Peptoniphilaceae bacterium]
MSIILAFIIFFIVVLFHEGGHFFAAKSVGIRVNEFSIGMGPAIWKKTKGETLYSLRALPLGGYCAMEGEDEESASPDSFDAAKPWQRFLTILAGPVMNLLIALLCFILYLGMVGEAVPVIDSFTEHSAFQTAGASAGDRVISVNDTSVSNL